MEWIAVIPVGLSLLVAAVLIPAGELLKRRAYDCIAIATGGIATFCCAVLLWQSRTSTIVYWFGNWTPRGDIALGISFVIDPFGAGMATLCSFLVTVALIFSWHAFAAVRTLFHSLMLIFLAAMNGFALTGDLFNLFVFFELMSVTAYALTGYKVKEKGPLEGAINFAVTNSIGAFALLIGIALLYGRTGALNMAQIGQALKGTSPDGLITMAFVLILTGFFIKGAFVPFHFWLADAHSVAPTPVCILFSGVMVELGLYGAFRIYWTIFHGAVLAHEEGIRVIFISLGVSTAIVGAIMCYLQRHLKRLLAYSTISHMGIMLVGAGLISTKGLAGSALYVLGHGCIKASLFMCVGILLHRLGSIDQIELRGKARRMWIVGVTFAIGGLGLAGFPPFGAYIGKALIEESGKHLGFGWIVWILTITSALTGGAVLRAVGVVFLGWGKRDGEESKSPTEKENRETVGGSVRDTRIMDTLAIILVLIPILVGVYSGLARMGESASARFVDQTAYINTVLHHTTSVSASAAGADTKIKIEGVIFSCVAALVAVAIALVSLFPDWVPGRVKALWSPVFRTIAAGFRRVDTGHIGDYVAWIAIGMVVAATCFALVLR